MQEPDLWIQLGIVVGVGLFLLVMLWPMPANGRRLLKKWGLPDATDQQVALAVRYLKRRRLLYPWLYGALWFVPTVEDSTAELAVVVLAGTLLAELIALRPPRRARREASLTPRGLFDIASRVVLGLYAAWVLGIAVFFVVDLRWTLLVWLVVSVLAAVAIIWAAVARPAFDDRDVDLALRTRSVHVAAGLGAAVAGALMPAPFGFLGIVLWIMLANYKLPAGQVVK